MELGPTPVLVIGGSLVGFSAAMFLEWNGVQTVLVEKQTGSSEHPRAIGFTPRTIELFRAIGISDRLPPTPVDFQLRRARIESLAGRWHEETVWTPEAKKTAIEYSPCSGASIAQDRLEPMLLEKASELGADIRLGTELVSFEQDTSGITARLRERNGREYSLRSAYMVAADGSRSSVRETLGIVRHGRGHIGTMRSVLFKAPLEGYLAEGVTQFNIDQPDLRAFLTTYHDGRWVLMFSDDKERDEQTLRRMIVKGLGDLTCRSISSPLDVGNSARSSPTNFHWVASFLLATRLIRYRLRAVVTAQTPASRTPSREGVLETHVYLKRLDDAGVRFRSFAEPYLDSCGMFRDAVISILAVIAKQERVRISERVLAGLSRARAQGTHSGNPIGRPKVVFDRARAIELRNARKSWREIARVCGVGITTVRRACSSAAREKELPKPAA